MPTTLSDFIPIAQAAKEYPTSRRTIERRRQTARDSGDADTYQHFIIRTKDDHEFTAPSKEQVEQLTLDGRIPEWFVHREWLAKEFANAPRNDDEGGRHPDQPTGGGVAKGDEPTDDKIVSALLTQLQKKDAQLERKDQQIDQLNETMRKLGNAFQQSAITMQDLLERLPALPSVVRGEATIFVPTPKPKQQHKPSKPRQTKSSQKVVDTTPKPKPRKQPTTKTQSTEKKKQPQKQPTAKQRSAFARLFFGDK